MSEPVEITIPPPDAAGECVVSCPLMEKGPIRGWCIIRLDYNRCPGPRCPGPGTYVLMRKEKDDAKT